MRTNRFAPFILAAGIITLPCSAPARQSNFTLPLIMSDTHGQSDTIWFGRDQSATNCVDVGLGEAEIPADSSTGPFDFRFLNPNPGGCGWEALTRDIRPYPPAGSGNSWKLKFPADSSLYPLTITWPDLAPFADQVRMYAGIVSNMDMKYLDGLTYLEPPAVDYFIRTLPIDSIAPDILGPMEAYNITHASAELWSMINPHGVNGTYRIEWGETEALGDTTISVPIEPRNDYVSMYHEFTGLSPDHTYYFRVAAWNKYGTTYSSIASFHTINLNPAGGRGCVFSLTFRTSLDQIWRRWLGLYDGATYCVDDSLGETPLPPYPPSGVTDIRFEDPRGYDRNCFDLGLYRDFRPLTGPDQVDTFLVHVQPGSGGLPIIMQWTDVASLFDGDVRLTDPFGGILVSIDMKSVSSYTLDLPALTSLYIITTHPNDAPLPAADVDSAIYIGGTSVHLRGTVSPNGSQSLAWFEYGTTASYGSTTDTVIVYAGSIIGSILGIAPDLLPGQVYHYRIVASNVNGVFYGEDRTISTSLTAVEEPADLPQTYFLSPNYPNPFNPSTTIDYQLPEMAQVSLRLYSLLGEEVKTLVDAVQSPGYKSIQVNLSDLPSGVYIYRLVAGSFTSSKKLVLMR